MHEEPTAAREVHELREAAHDEREARGWTYAEYLAQVRKRGEVVAKKLGLKRLEESEERPHPEEPASASPPR